MSADRFIPTEEQLWEPLCWVCGKNLMESLDTSPCYLHTLSQAGFDSAFCFECLPRPSPAWERVVLAVAEWTFRRQTADPPTPDQKQRTANRFANAKAEQLDTVLKPAIDWADVHDLTMERIGCPQLTTSERERVAKAVAAAQAVPWSTRMEYDA